MSLDMAEQEPSELLGLRPNILCDHTKTSLGECPNKYEYEELEDAKTWIRILILFPANNDKDDSPLHASLCPVRRGDELLSKLIPVSYTWGQEDPTSSLWLEDLNSSELGKAHAVPRCIPIRPNLEKLLRQFRRYMAPVPLWIDALCINQKDFYEKGSQVMHMDEVYRNRNVHIWLGESSLEADVALDFVQEWKTVCQADDGGAMITLLKHPDTPYKWNALWDFIGRPWFTRRWIVQEFVLSAQKHFFVGNRNFLWADLVSLVSAIVALELHVTWRGDCNECESVCPESGVLVHKRPKSLPQKPDRIESLIGLNDAYVAFNKDTEHLTLERLLDLFCGFFSQDPKDGIYAFLSMASDTRASEWVIDYSERTTASQVYTQATRHIIRQTERLDIICRSNPHTNHYSWVPWFGPVEMRRDDGHYHEVHGYNKNSLTTFGQSLDVVRDRLRLCCNPFCDGCKTQIVGVRHDCDSCANFSYCDQCITNALTSHAANHRFHRVLPSFGVYDASGGDQYQIGPESEFTGARGYDHDYSLLPVAGWFVDTVSSVDYGLESNRNLDGGMTLKINPSILPHEDTTNSIGSSDDFFRAITGNRLVGYIQINDHMSEERIGHVPKNWAQIVRDHIPPELSSDVSKGLPCIGYSEMTLVLTSISVMGGGLRQFARTEKSIGFVPRRTQPEDSICILAGCTVPVVLRRPDCCGNKNPALWTLIGECYIEGLMEGEFMKEVRRESLRPTNILLA